MMTPAIVGLLLTVVFTHRVACLRQNVDCFSYASTTDANIRRTNSPEAGRPEHDTDRLRSSLSKMGVSDRWLVDEYGRVRLFHGWNSVQKGFPWYSEDLRNTTKLRLYLDWGFNVVRLGCMWSGFEPADGSYNETYISILKSIVNDLERRGVYVILDMHQDVMSSLFGSYDGFPLWLVRKLPPSAHPYPWPFRPDHFMSWTDGYLSEAVGVAFQRLYDNYTGALDRLARFWAKVADVFKDDANVLGYELINEPWAGDIYSRPSLLAPGNAGRLNLAPAYDVLNAAIRRFDDRTLVFYEPVTWGVFSNGQHVGTGFDAVPGGPDYADRSVLAYHYYCWLVDVTHQHRPFGLLRRTVCDKIVGPKVFSAVLGDIRRTNGSSFLTEFGQCEPDSSANSSATVECDFVMTQADRFLASWTYWDTAFFDDHGHVNWLVARPFARVYARAVSGVPVAMAFNLTNFSFSLSYRPNGAICRPTEIFIPKLHYPNGFQVNTTEGVRWAFVLKERLLKVYLKDGANTTLVQVHIKPKPAR